jgi:LysM repeat protein
VSENAATPVAAGFGSFTLESLNKEATTKKLEFYDRTANVDAAPDTISWGGETEVNIEYFAKEDTRNIQVGRNLDDDVTIEGRLTGKNAVFNSNVLNSWRMARDRCVLSWNGLKYEVMISKAQFKAVDTFEVEYSIIFKVIRNETFKGVQPVETPSNLARASLDKLTDDVATIDASLAILASLQSKTILNSTQSKSIFDYIEDVINLGRQAASKITTFMDTMKSYMDKTQKILNAPKQILNGLRVAFKQASAAIQQFVGVVRGTTSLPGRVAQSIQSIAQSIQDSVNSIHVALGGTLTGVASPSGAVSASVSARRAALRAMSSSARMAALVDLLKPKQRSHRVRRGETLRSISRRYGITVAQLMEANPILRLPAQTSIPSSPSFTVRPGIELVIPTGAEE